MVPLENGEFNKGHKGKLSSFRTALLFLREIITIQLSSENHLGFCEERFRLSSRTDSCRAPTRAEGTPAPPASSPSAGQGAAPCCWPGDQLAASEGHRHHVPGLCPAGGRGRLQSTPRTEASTSCPVSVPRGCPMERRTPVGSQGLVPRLPPRWDTLGTGPRGPVGLGLAQGTPQSRASLSSGPGGWGTGGPGETVSLEEAVSDRWCGVLYLV